MEVPMLIGPAARRAGICPRLSDGLKPLGLHNGQQLERWPARPLRAALPLADQLWLHVEIMREHTLADARTFADGNDFLRRQRLDRRQTGGVERPHGGLVHQTDAVQPSSSLMDGCRQTAAILG